MQIDIHDLIFVGFNSRVAAMDLKSGEIIWDWRAPKPASGGYVTLLLLDENRLIASVNGYTYCLDPTNGEQLWYNELIGFGTGPTSIAAFGKQSTPEAIFAAAEVAARAADVSASHSS
jgi:outer membrane protein assembly factor BamB